MHTTCPFCKQTYEVEDQYLGQQIECQKCKHEFTIAQSQEPPQKTAAPYNPVPSRRRRGGGRYRSGQKQRGSFHSSCYPSEKPNVKGAAP